MKKLKKIFTLLLIFPLITLCFVGCSKNKEISLTSDNIRDYIIFNYSFVNENTTTSTSSSYIFTIETTKKQENFKFKNVQFIFNLKTTGGSYPAKYGNVVVDLDYNGVSKFSFHVYTNSNLGDIKNNIEFEITEITGIVIENN